MVLNEWAENQGLPINLDALVIQINDRLKGQLQAIAGQVLNLAVVTVTSLLDFLLTMVLAFYLQQSDTSGSVWNGCLPQSDNLFLKPYVSASKFLHWALIYATCMACALIPTWLKVPLVWLNYGIMALIPFGGTVGIVLTTVLVALQDVWLGLRVQLRLKLFTSS